MFNSCECGYYNCGICGPWIRGEYDSKVKKKEDGKKARFERLYSRKVMEFGKHKGKLIKDIPEKYAYWLLYYQGENLDNNTYKCLKERSKNYKQYRPYSYNTNYYAWDEEDYWDLSVGLPNT